MRKLPYASAAICCALALCGCGHLQNDRDILFQTSTIGALMEGDYDGHITCKELKTHGDLGIGTFDALDGEMIVLEGKVYQIRADGKAYAPEGSLTTPFAAVTFFNADDTILLDRQLDYRELETYLDSLLPTGNIPYAIQIKGLFDYMKTRSVPKQGKPYPRLVEVVKDQPTYEFHNVRGTVVGFRLPGYMSGINVPGYHLHFITEDRRAGGHVLDCSTRNLTIQLDHTHAFFMALPQRRSFYELHIVNTKETEVESVEK